MTDSDDRSLWSKNFPTRKFTLTESASKSSEILQQKLLEQKLNWQQ